jgi:hypothetical protein
LSKLIAVGLLDLGVYHKMLRGAVRFGISLEKSTIVPKIMKTSQGMTELITLYIQYKNVDTDTSPF